MNHKTSKAFICSKCGSKVIWQTFGIENGRYTWWACTNPKETHLFGLPAIEDDSVYMESAAANPNLEPWPEDEPLKDTIAGQEQQITRAEATRRGLEGIASVIIAASLLIGVWISLLDGVRA